jgi:acyl-homoserine lactone acylase PvdQ
MRKSRVKVWARRIALGLAVTVLLAVLATWLFLRGSLPQLDGTRQVAGLQGQVTAARDQRGVPLISGNSRLDVAYATGFVHAQDRYFQMDLLRRTAAGELAELFGPRAADLDKSHRLHRFRPRAELAVQALPAADRALLERYVGGVNDGLNSLSVRPFEYGLIGVAPQSWKPADSLLVVWANGGQLSAATWGERNTAAIAHPISSALPLFGRWLRAPADMLPGDVHMPRVAGLAFGQSERLTVSPGREEEGLFNMPGGQSGHPLSPFFLDEHRDWVVATPTPLLPGPAKHTLIFQP